MKGNEGRAVDLNDLLDRRAGVPVRSSGSEGSSARISIRGLEGKRVALFIDGRPLDTPDGSCGLNDISIQMIERIELYKGIVPAESR